MEELFQTDPAISSPHSVSVGVENCPTPATMVVPKPNSCEKSSVIIESSSSNLSDAPMKESATKRRRKDYCLETLEIKKKYFADRIELKNKKLKLAENYIAKKESDRVETRSILLNILDKLK